MDSEALDEGDSGSATSFEGSANATFETADEVLSAAGMWVK